MGVMVYSLLWVRQDLYHQPFFRVLGVWGLGTQGFNRFGVESLGLPTNPQDPQECF